MKGNRVIVRCAAAGVDPFGGVFYEEKWKVNLISLRAIKNSPGIQKELEINRKDERNVAIASRAKAKAYDLMIFVFAALMLSFALMEIDLVALLLLVFAYLFVVGSSVYYRCKFDKEM